MLTIVSPELEEYVHAHTQSQDALFDEMREYTYAHMQSPQMQVGRVEGMLLKTLASLIGAKRILEIGTFTGYSALSMAYALPEDGVLITCDIDPEAARVARTFFDRSPHGHKIEIRVGPALETLKSMSDVESFDLVFIDADKENYLAYYEAVLPRLRRNGLIVVDNTLWSGRVLNPSAASDHAIAALNAHIRSDRRVENVLLSVRDGMMLARKL